MTGKNLEAWSYQNSVAFYAQERSRVSDLYESESSMLLPIAGRVESVLDVGCAAGNFFSIFRELNPGISYQGIDTSSRMIEEARARHPGAVFHLGDGGDLPFADGAFDLVSCVGVLNHNPDYLEMIEEMFRVARRFVVVDLPRLVAGPVAFDPKKSYMVLKKRFAEGSDGIPEETTQVPYVLAHAEEAFEGVLTRLSGRLQGLACHGYYRSPHESVVIPCREVLFAVLLLVKGRGPLRYFLRLPDGIRPALAGLLRSAGGSPTGSVEETVDWA